VSRPACGQIIGHGERCSGGWLCSDCKEKSQIAEQERKRIVAYLQTNPDPIVRNWISAQIEAGEHLKEQSK
jgi:hypothetical protein